MRLPAVLAGFQAHSVTLSISALRRGDNGLSAPPVTLLPPPPQCEREAEERGGGLVERVSEQGVICCHACNCIVYVYL